MTKWNPDICIYHGNCDDGFGAAWAIRSMWPECDFVPGFYGMDLPNVDGKNVLFVDFSAKRPVIDAIAQTAKTIVIIDHHKTAEADLEPFKVTMCGSAVLNPHDIQHMFRDLAELGRPPIVAWFDTEQSGAVMAWQFAQGDRRDEGYIPLMLELIEDRDLWRFTRGDTTREFSAALRTYPMDFNVWDEISENPRDLYAEGKVILRAHRANIEKLMREAYTETIGGFAVPVVNAPYHYASDTAHELLTAYPDAPFAACWFRRADGQIQWSLRSEDHRQDVSEIAKGFGGGGHRNAAGFQSPAASPQTKAEDEHRCPICDEAFKPDDNCATDIELGTCHFDCLDGSPVVDLETGEEILDDDMHSFPYSDVMDPPPQEQLVGLDEATKQKLREALRFAASRSVMSSDDERRILAAFASSCDIAAALSAVIEGWDFWEVAPHDREPPRNAIHRARAALTTEGQPDAS